MSNTIIKGDWVQAEWMTTHLTCLAGVQTKFGGTLMSVAGTVLHIRGDHPTNPTSIRLSVQPDEGGEEVLVSPAWVKVHRPKKGPLNS
jgi:hypothetical protein